MALSNDSGLPLLGREEEGEESPGNVVRVDAKNSSANRSGLADDGFFKSGITIPITVWFRLFLAWVACILAGGFLPGQGLFTQYFAEAGIFYGEVCLDDIVVNTTSIEILEKQVAELESTEMNKEISQKNTELAATLKNGSTKGRILSSVDSSSNDPPTCSDQYLLLANLFGGLQALSLVAFLPAGLLFDALGGRWTGMLGAAILLVGLVMTIVVLEIIKKEIQIEESEQVAGIVVKAKDNYYFLSNILFPVGIFLTDLGSLINSFCLYAFLFHAPGWEGVIVALANCCYYVSAFLPVWVGFFMTELTLDLSGALGIYGLGVLLAILVIFLTVPTQQEYYRQAQLVLGTPIPRQPANRSIWELCFGKEARRNIRLGWKSLWEAEMPSYLFVNRPGSQGYSSVPNSNPTSSGVSVDAMVSKSSETITSQKPRKWRSQHAIMWWACCISNMATFVYTGMPNVYGSKLFNDNGNALALLCVTNVGFLGFTIGPLSGIILDKFGGGTIKPLLVVNAASMVILAVLFPFANWVAQFIAVTASNTFVVTNIILLSRYIIAFTPPTRLGTISGIFISGFSVAVTPLIVSTTYIILWIQDWQAVLENEESVIGGTKSGTPPPNWLVTLSENDWIRENVFLNEGMPYIIPTVIFSLWGGILLALIAINLVKEDNKGTRRERRKGSNEGSNLSDVTGTLRKSSSETSDVRYGQSTGSTRRMGMFSLFLPSSPPLLPEDEFELSRRFLCTNLEDATFLLGLTSEVELLQLSASQNMKDMRKISECMASCGPRLAELAMRKEAERIQRLENDASPTAKGCGAGSGLLKTGSSILNALRNASKERIAGMDAAKVSTGGDTQPFSDGLGVEMESPTSASLGGGNLTEGKREKASLSVEQQMPDANGFYVTDCTIDVYSAVKFTLDSFWPMEGDPSNGNPLLKWLSGGLERRRIPVTIDLRKAVAANLGEKDTSTSESAILEQAVLSLWEFQIALFYFVCMEFGHILQLRKGQDYCAILFCLPPGLIMQAGNELFHHGVAKVVELVSSKLRSDSANRTVGSAGADAAAGKSEFKSMKPIITKRDSFMFSDIGSAGVKVEGIKAALPSFGGDDYQQFQFPKQPPVLQLRNMLLVDAIERGRPDKPHWYVAILGTSCRYRGQKCGKRLLDIVHGWAYEEKRAVYLETDADTAKFYYEKDSVGPYRRIWNTAIENDQELSYSSFPNVEIVGLMYGSS